MTERSNEEVIADLLARAKPVVVEVPVCTAGDLVTRHAQLMADLNDLSQEGSLGGNKKAAALLAELETVEAEQEQATLVVKVSSVGRRAWADALRAHPPRPEDKGLDHNPDTFPVAAVALATGVPVEQIEVLAEQLPPGEWRKLWDAAVHVNVAPMPHPKVPAGVTELVRASGRSSTSRRSKASPAASSSDGNASP